MNLRSSAVHPISYYYLVTMKPCTCPDNTMTATRGCPVIRKRRVTCCSGPWTKRSRLASWESIGTQSLNYKLNRQFVTLLTPLQEDKMQRRGKERLGAGELPQFVDYKMRRRRAEIDAQRVKTVREAS